MLNVVGITTTSLKNHYHWFLIDRLAGLTSLSVSERLATTTTTILRRESFIFSNKNRSKIERKIITIQNKTLFTTLPRRDVRRRLPL